MNNETTLIIGNGFDLNLGLKTTYRQFAESGFWPIDNKSMFGSNLARYLEDIRSVDCWFDLERHLANYAHPTGTQADAKRGVFGAANSDKSVFLSVQSALCQYITEAEKASVDQDSLAVGLLRYVSQTRFVDHIFSYNYSDLNSVCRQLKIGSIDYAHVHGSCRDNTAILGISDEEKVLDGYDFLYKTSNANYQSSNVRFALQRSSLVIFFGHSLGPQDYHYFSDFFSLQSQPTMQENDSKKIIFVTYDENS